MTEHSHKGGTHDVSRINPQVETAPQPLSEFEKNLNPEEREMFLEYKDIFSLLNEVTMNVVKYEINFEKEIISLAEIFHRLGILIDGIVKEFQEKHSADDLANVYQLERITDTDSSATIVELEKKCRDKLNEARYYPTIWGSSQYKGLEFVLMVVDWKIRNGDCSGAQGMLDHIPSPAHDTDLISQSFENRDYFSEGYRRLARAQIGAGQDPMQEMLQNPERMCVQLAAACHAYIDAGDLKGAERTLQTLCGWPDHVREAKIEGKKSEQIFDAWYQYTNYAREDYTIIKAVHALALAKKQRGADYTQEVEQSQRILKGLSDREVMRLQSDAVLAYCAYDAVTSYAHLGVDGEPLNFALDMLKENKDEFYPNTKTPYSAIAYAAVGDGVGAEKNLLYSQSLPIPSGIRHAAEMAFECGQETTGQQLAALLEKLYTEQHTPKPRSEYNSVPVAFLKEHLRMRRFIARREGRLYVFPVSEYEDMLEYDLNNEHQNDRAEDCALEHISAALVDIDSWHGSLSDEQREKVRSGVVAAFRKMQKDDVVIPSLTKLRRPFREEVHLWRFVRFTGVTLDPALVQSAYSRCLFTWQHSIDIAAMLEGLEDIRNATGVAFDPQQHTTDAMRMYEKMFDTLISLRAGMYIPPEYFAQWPALQKFTGVPISAEVFSRAFKSALANPSNHVLVWEFLTHFKDIPLVWDEIDVNADAAIYESTRKMSSNDLQKKMWSILADVGALIPRQFDSKGWPGDFSRSSYPNMPPYIYGVWVAMFNRAMPVITDWFLKAVNDAYAKIQIDIGRKKPGSRAILDRLTYGIIEGWHIDCDMRRFLGGLNEFVKREISPKELSDLVYAYALLSQLYASMNLEGLSPAGEIREGRDSKKVFTGSVSEYIEQLERQAGKLFGEIIGIPNLSYEHVMRLKEEWGSFDVVLTLAGKYANGYEEGLPLFREMLRAEFENRWHEYRYDESDPIVARQFEGCTDDEKKGWIDNSPAKKLSDVALEAIEMVDLADSIKGHIYSASFGRHIYLPEYEGRVGHLFEKTIHELLLPLFAGVSISRLKNEMRSFIYEKKTLPDILEKVGVVLGPDDEGFDVQLSVALEREISVLESLEKLTRTQKILLGHLNVACDWLTTSSGFRAQKAKDFNILGISDATPLADLEEVFKALETVELLARLNMISAQDIKSGELPPYILDAGRPDPLISSIEKLIKIFEQRQSPFVQDLKNIQVLLAKRFEVGLVEHLDLTIRESDDLKESLESGKYPIGASSCQNYESDAHYTKCLLARGGDADKKNVIIEKSDKTIVVENELKLVYIDNGVPAIFIEPSNYSAIRERYDVTNDVNRYAQAKARRMSERTKVMRGADKGEQGAILVTVRPSRNHYQYEDGKHGGPGHGGLGVQEGEYTMWAVEV